MGVTRSRGGASLFPAAALGILPLESLPAWEGRVLLPRHLVKTHTVHTLLAKRGPSATFTRPSLCLTGSLRGQLTVSHTETQNKRAVLPLAGMSLDSSEL